MSVTSVGASFGYINPASLAGPTQSAAASSDTDSTSGADSSGNASQASTPKPPPPQATTSDAPKFAPDTASALVKIQEKATAA